MKKQVLIGTVLTAIVFLFLSCKDSEESDFSVWEGKTEDATITLTINDETTCMLRFYSNDEKFCTYMEVFRYERWYGVNQMSLYSQKNNSETLYIGRFEGNENQIPDKMKLVRLIDEEEFFMANLTRN